MTASVQIKSIFIPKFTISIRLNSIFVEIISSLRLYSQHKTLFEQQVIDFHVSSSRCVADVVLCRLSDLPSYTSGKSSSEKICFLEGY